MKNGNLHCRIHCHSPPQWYANPYPAATLDGSEYKILQCQQDLPGKIPDLSPKRRGERESSLPLFSVCRGRNRDSKGAIVFAQPSLQLITQRYGLDRLAYRRCGPHLAIKSLSRSLQLRCARDLERESPCRGRRSWIDTGLQCDWEFADPVLFLSCHVRMDKGTICMELKSDELEARPGGIAG